MPAPDAAFENSYRDDGRGGVAYPPASLIALLLYCYFPGIVPVRDSKRPHGPMLLFPATAWGRFVAAPQPRCRTPRRRSLLLPRS